MPPGADGDPWPPRFEDFGVAWKPRMVGGRWDPIGRPLAKRGLKGFTVPICGAMTNRTRKPCTRAAIPTVSGEWGRCLTHGGALSVRARRLENLANIKNPALVAARLKKRMEELSTDTDLASIDQQVALAAAAVEEYVANLLESGAASLTDEQVEKLVSLSERLTRMTERRHKVREGIAVKVQYEFLDSMTQVVVRVVNEALRHHLREYPQLWEAIVLDISQKLRSFNLEDKGRKEIGAARS